MAIAAVTWPATAAHAAAPGIGERNRARSLAAEGNAAFVDKQLDEALARFEEAEAIVHAPTHLLMIARTRLAKGELVGAKAAYERVVAEHLDAAAPAAFRNAQGEAARELAALAPRLPSAKITVDKPDAAELIVLQDGAPIDPDALGTPRTVDPGKHTFEAKAAGLRARAVVLNVSESERYDVALTLLPIAVGEHGADAEATAREAPRHTAALPARSIDGANDPAASSLRVVSIGALTIGAAGLATGLGFMVLAHSKQSEADAADQRCGACSGNARRDADALDHSAATAHTVSVVGLVAGGAFVATGLGLLVGSGAAADRAERRSLQTRASVGLGSIRFDGTF